MATLVFSTVGTMLGGPVGGAIGSFLGQSIDQQLLGQGPRHGPRIGDLSVQSSSYGTAIPKVFGTMRVAGSVIWSTDLVEQSETEIAKGEGDRVNYSYAVSFAVALSARRIINVRRIWADGKLIRDADGALAVPTTFRFHDGSEDQPVDPLIATVEGLNRTPAYRGLALALFEDLQLAEFGNRIPFLTFEVEADEGPVPLSAILSETSGGAIDASELPSVVGYAAHGSTIAGAVEPLIDMFHPAIYDAGPVIASAETSPEAIAAEELGCAVETAGAARLERSTARARSLPSSVTLTYYDPARDYQTGVARTSTEAAGGAPEHIDLPAVIDADAAKGLVSDQLARRWAGRDRVKIALPPSRMELLPGTTVDLGAEGRWTVDAVTLDSFVVRADLRPVQVASQPLPGDPGRMLPSTAVPIAPTRLELAELPAVPGTIADQPLVVAAASGKSIPIAIEIGGRVSTVLTPPRPATFGTTLTSLAPSTSALFDLKNSFDVALHDTAQWIESRADDALMGGANMAIVGSELVQFGTATETGSGLFRLSRLLRGRWGTEWAMAAHQAGETFILLDPARLRTLSLSVQDIGATLSVTPGGWADAQSPSANLRLTGEALRPPSPVHLDAFVDSSGTLICRWVRRSAEGWAWLDGVDVPLGCSVERYRVVISGPSGAVERESFEPLLILSGGDLASIGSGEIEISVSQVGDFAASRPAMLRKILN